MKLIKLTRPDGEIMLVNVDYISMLMPNDGGYDVDVKSIILTANGAKYGVKETMKEIGGLIG